MRHADMSIGKRVKDRLNTLEWRESELARKSGVPRQTINKVTSGEIKSPRAEILEPMASALGVTIDWLVTGKELKSQQINMSSAVTTRQISNKNTIEIPQFDIEASMGAGKFPPDYQQPVITISVDKDFFIRQGINVTQSSKLSIITGIGDSMEGTFNDGDPVVINHEARSLIADGIYVFTLEEKLYLKRLQILPNCVRMISDNAKYPPYDIKGEELQQLVIHGKALFVWNGQRI